MRKNVFFFVFLTLYFPVFVPATAAAQQAASRNGHTFSLGTSIGFLIGESEEIVYQDDFSGEKKSQLLWPLLPLLYAGIDIRYSLFIPAAELSVFTDAVIKVGIPLKSGEMEDRDWLGVPGELTNYSVHDNKTRISILLDLNAGISLAVSGTILIKPFISYNFMYLSWIASGGSGTYPPPDGHITFSGDVGTYRQFWNIISPGFGLSGEFGRFFNIDLFVKLSPFVWCYAKDEHLLRTPVITFHDTLVGNLFFEAGSSFSFNLNDFFSLSLSVAYRRIKGTRGDTYMEENGQLIATSYYTAGAGYSAFDVGLVARFTIF